MQLKPVRGKYIWCQRKSLEFLHAFMVQPHWDKFDVISLVENHRQNEDAEYANLLNRLRLGEHTEEDMISLEEQVRPEGHGDFFTRRISLLLRQFTTASIRLLVYYSTFYVKTTILLDCSRPSHPSSRGYLGQVQQGEIRFHVWQRLTIGIGWAE